MSRFEVIQLLLNDHPTLKLSATFICVYFLTNFLKIFKTPCETSSLLHALRAVYFKVGVKVNLSEILRVLKK